MEVLELPNWPKPKGYSNGIAAKGRIVFIAGQVGWDEHERFPDPTFVGQARQALKNIVAILAQAGGKPEHLTRMTWYVGDVREYRDSFKPLGEVYRTIIGRHYPVMTGIQVAAFVEEGAKVEIEATAVIPE